MVQKLALDPLGDLDADGDGGQQGQGGGAGTFAAGALGPFLLCDIK